MAEKRERLDVIKDILVVVRDSNNKIGPTKLIRLSNLSPLMFKEYINELVKSNLLIEKEEKNKKYYSVGDKGFKFLERYSIFKNFVDELGL
jgi:predicted transcriptional regulator